MTEYHDGVRLGLAAGFASVALMPSIGFARREKPGIS